jgi:putative endonuclease
MNMNYTYILKCADNTLYTGWTNNLEKRLADHNAGKGAKYTRGRAPLEPVYLEPCPDRSTALKREYAIKQLPRQEKLRLAENFKCEPATDC